MAAEKAKTERIKHLLSSYYGAPGSGAGGAGGAAAAHPPDSPSAAGTMSAQGDAPSSHDGALPHQQQQRYVPAAAGAAPAVSLDSPAFNAERHVAALIASAPLERLLAEHKGMAREIKNLDSDMQQLVYENYNKFISATDTIRAMKANVDGMEADMAALRDSMDTVVERSGAVNAKLLKRRQHIEELSRVQALLAKLQAVFELPARMQAALQEDALDSAVSFYAEAAPMLRKHGHKGAFRGVAAQADAAAKQISAVLKRRLAERKDDTEHIVLLLRQLGEGDDTLQERYLQGRAERMQRILHDAAAVADALAAARTHRSGGGSGAPSSALPAGVDAPAAWGFGPDGSPPSLAAFVKALDERLINALQETVVNMNTLFLQHDRTPARRKPLVAVARAAMDQYFRLVRRVVTDASLAAIASAACLDAARAEQQPWRATPSPPSLAFGDAWGADLVLQAMSAVSTDVGLLHSQLPELSLRDWAAAAVEQAVQGHIAAAFAALRERITTGVQQLAALDAAQDAAGSALPPQVLQLLPAYTYLCDVTQRGTAALLKALRAYEQGKMLAGWQDQLSDAVQAQLQAMFQALAGQFSQLAKGAPAGPAAAGSSGGAAAPPLAAAAPSTALVLLLAKLCMFMEASTVPHVMEVLAVAFQGRGQRARGDAPPQFVGGEVARRLGSTSRALLGAYVELHGCRISLLVQHAMASTDWQGPPPTRPQPFCGQLLQELARVEAEVSRLLERGSGGAAGHHQRGGSITDALLDGGAVERGVAKLFRGKVTPFGPGGLRPTQGAVLAAVAIGGLKSLVECVRLQTLGRGGLQQLQLDAAYLRPRLLQLVGGAEAEPVAQLLDDVVGAAAERATEPALLDAPALVALLQQADNDAAGAAGGGSATADEAGRALPQR